jgi:hypothetical protein
MRYLLIPLMTLGLTAQSALAQLESPIKPPTSVGISGGGIIGLACLGLRWLFTAAIIFSIIMALVAGYRYMTSAGDPAKVTLANNTLIYVAIGVAVAILARTVPILVGSVVAGSARLDPCGPGTTQNPPTNNPPTGT